MKVKKYADININNYQGISLIIRIIIIMIHPVNL
jgi:hypothetical protein